MPDERTLNSLQGKAAEGLAILNRLVPAPDHGRGFRRDPETGSVYYSSGWLNDDASIGRCEHGALAAYCTACPEGDAKAPE